MGDTPLHRAAFTGRAVSLLCIQLQSILQASFFVLLCTNDPFRPICTQQQFFFCCTVHLVYRPTYRGTTLHWRQSLHIVGLG